MEKVNVFFGSIKRVKDFVSHVTPFDADMDLSKPLEQQIHAEREEAEKILASLEGFTKESE